MTIAGARASDYAEDVPPLTPLSPAQVPVLRLHAALGACVGFLVSLMPGLILLQEQPAIATALVAGTASLAVAYASVMPRRRYRSWGYAVGKDELHVAHGVLTRVRTAVPFGRVQHLDVAQGPVQRRYGVATLILHTAGTRAATVTLPGLDRAEAERLRDEIRAKIRADLA